jgi:D-alanyl-D-alanine carboxypeptidase
MMTEKRIKTLIIISLLLIQTFVWTANGSNHFWSLGLGNDSDNPGTVNVGDDSGQQGEEKPSQEQPDQGNEDQQDQNPDDQGDRAAALEDAQEKGLLMLVNKEHPVDPDYKPDDLTKIKDYVPDRSETTRYLRAKAADAFHQMVDKAAQDGVELKMTTAYRSYDFQKILFDSYVQKEGEEKANTFSAKPGQSEHQTGLAVDVSSPSVDYQLSDDYGKTKEGKWISDEAYRFGFILRFPKGKEDITGYQYEPWHLRYVGLTAAKEIHEEGLTLEEYLQKNNNIQ